MKTRMKPRACAEVGARVARFAIMLAVIGVSLVHTSKTDAREDERADDEPAKPANEELARSAARAFEDGRAEHGRVRAEIRRAQEQIAAERESRRSGIVPLPALSYAPETGLNLGGYVLYFRHLGDVDETRPSTVELSAVGTTNKQLFLGLDTSVWLSRNAFNVRGSAGFDYFPAFYYGIGKHTTLDQEEPYTARIASANTAFMARLAPSLYLGVRGALDHHVIEEVEPARELAAGVTPGSRGGLTVGLAPALTLDTRDFIFATTRGVFVDAWYAIRDERLGSQFNHGVFNADVRLFFPIKGTVLAVQGLAFVSHGTLPFFLLPRMGGDGLRGVFFGRFRDRHLVEAQAEYRFPIFWRVGGTFFGGVGQVARRLTDFVLDDFVPAGGAGVRYAIAPAERLNIRFDYAYSNEGPLYYLTVGEAF
jgi:hypothetical protein